MTPERRRLALRAAGAAHRIRQKQQIAADQPCCVYDLAEALGIEVRFADLPSAEGVYSPTKPVIIVSSLRPPGRQAFTCAHEVGKEELRLLEAKSHAYASKSLSRLHIPSGRM